MLTRAIGVLPINLWKKNASSSPNLEAANMRSHVGAAQYHNYTQTGGGSLSPYFGDTAGYIVGLAYDADNGTMKYYQDNVLRHTDSTLPTDGTAFLAYIGQTVSGGPGFHNTYFNFGADSSFAGQKTAQGNQDENDKGDFYYTPPAGYLALCTDNLPDPLIALPTNLFDTALYTGTGSELSVSDLSFQPDFTWIKTRGLAYNHRVFDVVRGVTKELYTNANNAEVTDAQSLKSFDSDGFTLGTSSGVNPSSSSSMVSWNWKAGGAASN